MLTITSTLDKSTLESAKMKADRLCKLYKCSMIDLIVISIDVQSEIKKAQLNNKQ